MYGWTHEKMQRKKEKEREREREIEIEKEIKIERETAGKRGTEKATKRERKE